MPLKTLKFPPNHLVHPGGTAKMGRRRPTEPYAGRHLVEFLGTSLPTPPTTTHNRTAAQRALRKMYLNDQLGDCIVAGALHIEGTLTGNSSVPVGNPIVYTNGQVVSVYERSGYRPGDPSTDQGWECVPMMQSWRDQGLPSGSKITGWLAVDPTNVNHLRLAVWLFENLYFGLGLPDAWINPMPAGDGFVWDVAGDPDPNNGHCVDGFDLEPAGVEIDTWAMEGTLTWAAIAEYAAASVHGEVFTILSPDVISRATRKCPAGVDWATLQQYFGALT